MKQVFYFFFFLLWLCPAKLLCQVSFSATPLQGCHTLTVQFTYTGTEVPSTIIWRFGNGDTSHLVTPPPVVYDAPGMYDVSLSVNGGTPVMEYQYIKIRKVPAADFVYKDTLTPGSFNYVFHAAAQPVDTATYSFEWSFRDDSTSGSASSIMHQYTASGLYPVQLIVTDDFGCADTLLRLVNISEKIYVPNVFTPNNDGTNDAFVLPVDGLVTYKFCIFSRYGALLYKSVSKHPGWDGTNSAGVFLNQGIYYYTLESLDPAKPLSQAGFIHLFK